MTATAHRKWNPTIVAAVITGGLAFLGVVTAAIITIMGKSVAVPSPSPVNSAATTTATAIPAAERRSHYTAAFRGSTVEGDVTWPTDGSPRVSGVLKLQGSMARSACSVRVVFEVRGAASSESLDGGESKCGSTSSWPTYDWTVPSKHAAEADRIDILIRVESDIATRISCTRSGDCRTP
jgi:hypothetical protein